LQVPSSPPCVAQAAAAASANKKAEHLTDSCVGLVLGVLVKSAIAARKPGEVTLLGKARANYRYALTLRASFCVVLDHLPITSVT
jgi:hypothetical protein